MEAWEVYDFNPNAPKYGSPILRCEWCEEDILKGECYYIVPTPDDECRICGKCFDEIGNSGRIAGED